MPSAAARWRTRSRRESEMDRRLHGREAQRPLLGDQTVDYSQYPQRGLAEDGYYEENPWYGDAARRPIFSLGKPLPHKIRRRTTNPAQTTTTGAADIESGCTADEEFSDAASLSPSLLAARIQHQEERATAAGQAHGDRTNDAGQPVFEYVPENTQSPRRASAEVQSLGSMSPVSKAELAEQHGLIEPAVRDDDELRNWWARIRAQHPEPLAEFLATGVAVLLGLTGTLSVNLSASQSTQYGTYETSCWAWGFYLGGGVSGAHMNPVISLSLALFRGFPWSQCAVYVVAQFLASLTAGGLAYGLYADSIRAADPQLGGMGKAFFSTPQPWVSLPTALLNQVVGSAVMMVAVFALGDDQNNPPGAGMHALVLGFLLTTLKFTLGYNIGSALNPASDFGPRLVAYMVGCREAEVFRSGWWFYGPWAATVVGSILGCVLYDSFVFVGSESPINYRYNTRPLKARIKKLLQ